MLVVAFALASPRASGEPGSRANVVVIMTDDQNLEDLKVMTKTRSLIGDQGVTFNRYYVSDPLCCPSRATFYSGQYAHNHGVLFNRGPNAGYAAFNKKHSVNLWLRRAGYRTAQIGRFLNSYGIGGRAREVPPGWDEWAVAPGNSAFRMFDYVINRNGRLHKYGRRAQHYQTDVYARLATQFIRRVPARKPFFLSLTPLAPHTSNSDRTNLAGPEPAPRHQGRFRRLPLPRPPSFNEFDVGDKPAYVNAKRRLTRRDIADLRTGYRRRLASLLAVDDLVAKVVRALQAERKLDNTYIFFTSDNGFMLGEHRLRAKPYPYEENIHLPLLIRGPGVPQGETRSQLGANIDLTATILDIAGAESRATRPLDGLSLLPAIESDESITRPLLIEAFRQRPFGGVRVGSWVFVRNQDGFEELYDLESDPFQLDNIAGDPGAEDKRAELALLLQRLRHCRGADCRPPAAPVLTGTDPASPGVATSPRVMGTTGSGDPAEAVLYASPDCSGPVLATGAAQDLVAGGIEVTVDESSTTQLSALLVGAGASACSNSISYVHLPPVDPPDPDPDPPPDP